MYNDAAYPSADRQTPSPSPAVEVDSRDARLKRLIDIVLAVTGLLLATPLCLLAAGLIWLCDGRPIFLSQWRVQRGEWLFRMYKFRTMYRHAERATGAVCAQRNDPRVIPACRWIRRAHIDELPQLWNVLRGEMSLVGPRPERPEIAHDLRSRLAGFSQRTSVKPGLTGLAQLRLGYASRLEEHKRKLRLDLAYVRTRSTWTDLKLLVLTTRKLWDRSAC